MGSFNHGLGLILYYTLASLAVLLISPVTGVSVNITVDDTFGNSDGSVIPTYLPANNTIWHVGSPSEQCDSCSIRPSMLNSSQILDQSWHYAVYDSDIGTPIQVHVTFQGTAVYVYNVLPNTLPTGAIDSNISFALDGKTVGTFVCLPASSSDFLYNQLVYANTSLSDSVHTLVMSASGNERSLIFFDYLLYTIEATLEGTSDSATATVTVPVTSSPAVTDTSGTSASSVHPPTAAIAGGVAGGVALLLVGAALLCLVSSRLRRRRRQTLARPLAERTDFASEGTTTPSIATLESIQPLHIGPQSNAATVAGETSTSTTTTSTFTNQHSPATRVSTLSRPGPFASESKREAVLRRRNDSEVLQRETDVIIPPSHPPHAQEQTSESVSESNMSDRLGTNTVLGLQGEIAALRDVLQNAMAAGRVAAPEIHDNFNLNQPAMLEALPAYEELDARPDRLGAGSG